MIMLRQPREPAQLPAHMVTCLVAETTRTRIAEPLHGR
jgi:hypothetical protein